MNSSFADPLLLAVLLIDLYLLATSRITAAIRLIAFQGAALSLLPFAFAWQHHEPWTVHAFGIMAITLALKVVLIPILLFRAVRVARVTREVEPFISLKASLFLGGVMTGGAFWMASTLKLPVEAPSTLVVPVALTTLFVGFLVVVSRRKAITQVLGYLMLENGIYVFGLCLAREMPFLVELGMLLDLLVGVFVMGIAINHISREYEAIDTDTMATLKD